LTPTQLRELNWQRRSMASRKGWARKRLGGSQWSRDEIAKWTTVPPLVINRIQK